MRKRSTIWITLSLFVLLSPLFSVAQTVKQKEVIKENDAKIEQYKKWWDQAGSKGLNFWLRLDSGHKPHRLYVGEGFEKADYNEKQRFIDIFSHYLARVADKHMLIDIHDRASRKAIGE